ncbi:hypothetical protein BO78DRAFT_414343 [Aspergillus sclerotiicarbonarius CBS 121057]|uniref:C6 zinc finger domain protein n=1 Tax=Aspergillus sclerotiicarbonarius (strain CBS 121057 / IBT 28362) TaxID=1448318 RepID=A0A319EZQ4_ASPSB|nr:hypothetical protein BO78DRAFT_414343 [Aspergillus sclerotiicarbonarius CBS 121057]
MVQVIDGFRWPMTSDERRCFSYFQHHTIPSLLEMFDSPLWRKLVLQMSYSEPAVYHAAVALSAAHEDIEGRGFSLLEHSRGTFALEQSLRSFDFLSRRYAPQDPRLREIMLLCCLLYILVEVLHGSFDHAIRHLRSGLRILKEVKAHRQLIGASQSPVETSLVAAFAELDFQAPFFEPGGAVLRHDDELEHSSWLANFPRGFKSVLDAQQAFGPLLYAAYRFVGECTWLPPGIPANYNELLSKQEQILSQFSEFADLFEHFYKSSPRLSWKDKMGSDILYAQLRHVVLSLETCLLPGNRACATAIRQNSEHIWNSSRV